MDKATLKHEVANCLTLLEEELRSFVVNARAGLFRKAIANLYYATYSATCAILWSKGIRAESYDGAQSMLSLHFVKAGVFARETTKKLNALMADRHAADYKGDVQFGAEDVANHRAWVVDFVSRAMQLLKAGSVNADTRQIDEALAAVRSIEIAEGNDGGGSPPPPGGRRR